MHFGVSSIAKDQRIDEAKRNIERAKRDLQYFAREASGLYQEKDISIDLNEVVELADAFFNNLMKDFYACSKIDKAQRQIKDGIRKIEAAICIIENA